MPRFIADFDIAGVGLSVTAVAILFFFGLQQPNLFKELWVAFGFWFVGFFGSYFLGIVHRTRIFTLAKLLSIGIMTGILIIIDLSIQYAFEIAVQGSVAILSAKLMSFAIGVSEELFFGIFLLGILINWLQLNPALAILISAGSHTFYHIPNWGSNPIILTIFFIGFLISRSIYVYIFPKAGMLLGWHGILNFGVT